MLAFIVMPYCLTAQEKLPKIHELGFNFAGLNSFGVRYRTGTENTQLRLTLLSVDGSTNKTKNESDLLYTNKSAGIAFNIGFEKRKKLSNNLSFYYGMDLLTSYTGGSSKNDQLNSDNKQWSIGSGAGLVLGFAYKFNNDISLSAEVVPSFLYTYSKSTYNSPSEKTVYITSDYDYGLGTSGANLTLSFRLGKKD